MRRQGIDQWDSHYPTEEDLSRDITAGTLHVLAVDGEIVAFVVVDETNAPEWAGRAKAFGERFW